MLEWFSDGRKLLAAAIILAAVIGARMFRYEAVGPTGWYHRNRIAGATCIYMQECWFRSGN
jgi:hypothetical protein